MQENEKEKGEVLLINKPLGWTSFDVVKYIRKALKVKVGHAGTLDPLAAGLLIVCTGRMTKRIEEFQNKEKEYSGVIRLGATTPSYDGETEINQIFPVFHITDDAIAKASENMLGVHQQVPPLYSAKKIQGERAYAIARRGEYAEIKPKEIIISKFSLMQLEKTKNHIDVHFCVVCSKGTYIRALARDFAEALQTGGHLVSLVRTRIGEYELKDAKNIEDFRKF